MGCLQTKSEKSTQVKIDPNNVPNSEEDDPPPYVPDSHKHEPVDEEYKHRIIQRIVNIPATTTATYAGLLKYLSEGTESETQHVTAIYYWMKCQDYDDPGLDLVKPGDTPRGYMKMIKDGEGDVCTFFTILCRRSVLPCVIIEGIGKGDNYRIGTPEKEMVTRWNAVFADDEWHLLHVEWAIGGARDGNQNTSSVQDSSDFFFLIDPEDFAYICHPDNHRWQLLHQPVTKKQFLGFPIVRKRFFELDMSIVEPTTGRVKTANGKQTIELAFPKRTGEHVRLRYSLTPQEHDSRDGNGEQEKGWKNQKANRFVFVNRKSTKAVFEMVLPEPGKYIFDIFSHETVKTDGTDTYAGTNDMSGDKTQTDGTPFNLSDAHVKTVEERLCQFVIISDRKWNQEDLDPLPECPDIGWGPGPECRDVGLVPLTHFEGYIFTRPGATQEVRFKKTKDVEVQCKLSHNFLPVYDLVEQVTCMNTEREVTIPVQIKEEGQYALVVYGREPGTKEYHEACYYLLKQQTKSRLPEKYRDKMLRERLEYHIDKHTSEEELISALEVFECYNCPDNGERTRAMNKVKHYWEVKRELEGALLGRNKTALRKWIERAKRSPYRKEFEEKIQKAEAAENRVVKLGYSHPIAKMSQHTITEIHNYKHPPPVVHDVMTSTFILLGEDKSDLKEWSEVQYLMGRPGKDSLQKRIIARSPDDVTLEEVEEADTVIEPYSLQKCRVVSTGVATFYKWCKQFSSDSRQKYMAEEERKETQDQQAGRETFRDPENATSENSRTLDRDSPQQNGNGRSSSKEDMRTTGTNTKYEHDRSLSASSQRSTNNHTNNKHPFGVGEKEDEVSRPKFLSQTPMKNDEVTPVSYAGFRY